MENRYLNMQGSKRRHVDEINFIIKKIFTGLNTEDYIYCEPFLGSGTVFLSLENNFKEYWLNDIVEELLFFFDCGKHIRKNLLLKYVEIEQEKYNMEKNKEGYYKFRDRYNEIKYEDNKEKKTIMLWMLINTCINCMPRFGKNGFNQGYGNRRYSNKIDLLLNAIEVCKEKRIRLFHADFRKFFKNLSGKTFLFLDPPYYLRKFGSHDWWKEQDTSDMCDYLLENKKIKFIYTDIYKDNKYVKKLIEDGCEYKIINFIRNIPIVKQKKKLNYLTEVIVYRK